MELVGLMLLLLLSFPAVGRTYYHSFVLHFCQSGGKEAAATMKGWSKKQTGRKRKVEGKKGRD